MKKMFSKRKIARLNRAIEKFLHKFYSANAYGGITSIKYDSIEEDWVVTIKISFGIYNSAEAKVEDSVKCHYVEEFDYSFDDPFNINFLLGRLAERIISKEL